MAPTPPNDRPVGRANENMPKWRRLVEKDGTDEIHTDSCQLGLRGRPPAPEEFPLPGDPLARFRRDRQSPLQPDQAHVPIEIVALSLTSIDPIPTKQTANRERKRWQRSR